MSGLESNLRRVGRYEILLDLQDEGFVSLMVAKVRGPNAGPPIVELSRVERALAREVEVRAAFLAEARAAGRVRHANFIHPVDTLVHEGDLYGATEFAIGVRLDQLWRAAAAEHYQIPLAVSLRILVEVLAGLSALHATGANAAGSRPIVHGDVAPTNVFITDRGEARLVHSGLASVTSRAGAIGRHNGRLAYKAPEQLRARVNAVPIDPTADVFAMGVLLWEALTGTRLFEHDNDVDIVGHILYGEIPPLEAGGQRYMPIALLPLVANALERNADVRTPNAATLAEAIERAPGIPLGTTEEVAAVLDQLMGPLMERQRRRVDELVARSEEAALSDGSLKAVVAPRARRAGSMRTPVGIVYPPPSVAPPPRSKMDTPPPDSRPPQFGPRSTRTPLSTALTAVRSVRRRPARPSTSGLGGWGYYLAVGALGGALVFSLVGAIVKTWASRAPATVDNASSAPAVTALSPAPTTFSGTDPTDEVKAAPLAPLLGSAVAPGPSASAPSGSATLPRPVAPPKPNRLPSKPKSDIPSGI